MKTLIKFGAKWCVPCNGFDMAIKDYCEYSAQENSTVFLGAREPVKYRQIDIDYNPELTKEYFVRSIPTVILVDEYGAEIKRLSVHITMKELINFLNT